MLAAIKYDEKNGKHTYMYLDWTNNHLNIHGFEITNNGVSNMNKSFVYELLEIFWLGNESEQLDDYLGFQVYLDKKTGLKHYFKDGKENFSALFKFNGDNALNYEKYEDIYSESKLEAASKKTKNRGIYKFKIFNTIILCAIELNLVFSLMALYDVSIKDIKSFFDNITEVTIDESGQLNYGILANKVNNLDEVNKYIYESPCLTELDKEYLANDDFIKDVLLYTKDTKMDYLYNLKLYELEVKYFKGEADDSLIGYYTMRDPNVINGKEGVDKKYWMTHEFFHLLQYPGLKYDYLCEATASIGAFEYYDDPIVGYPLQTKNVRKLMDVIGPKIIWEYVFTGDDTKLNNILKENLTIEEYLMFTDILEKNNGRDEVLSNLIDKLYLNIYKADIKSNQDIYDIHGNFIDKRVYFNESRMLENNYYTITVDKGLELGIINDDSIIYYEIASKPGDELLFEQYNIGGVPTKTKYEPLVLLDGCTIDNDGIVNLYYPNGIFATMTIEEAVNTGVLEKKIYIYLTDEQFNLAKDSIKEYEVITAVSFKEKMGNAMLAPVKVYYQNISQRFPNDTVRSQESKLEKKFNF